MKPSVRRRLAVWLGTGAILLNAVAPAVSHALAGQRGAAWLEVCTEAGITRVAVDSRRDRPDRPSAIRLAHCPYCAPHGASFAAPPAAPVQVAEPHVLRQAAVPGEAQVRGHPVRPTARPRAPPVS